MGVMTLTSQANLEQVLQFPPTPEPPPTFTCLTGNVLYRDDPFKTPGSFGLLGCLWKVSECLMTASNDKMLELGRVAAMLPVRDIEKSYLAYKSVFGFEKTFENGDPVGFMILKKDNAELHLTLQKSHHAPAFNVAHLLVSNADEACRRCEEQGFRIIKGMQDKG